MNWHRSTAALLCAVAITACDKNAVQVITAPAEGAYVRFANFGLSAPAVNFYANDTKITAISTASCTPATDPRCTTTGIESATGVAAGAYAIASGLYSSVAPGSYTLTGRISAAVDKDLIVARATTNLESGKYYTFYTSGTYSTAAKTVDAFVVEDPIPAAIDYTVALVRFVNAISNSNAGALSVRNQATTTVTAIGGSVPYKSAGTFTPIPGGVYDLALIYPGLGVAGRTGVSFIPGRIYTVTSRGDVTATTGASVPALDNTANR